MAHFDGETALVAADQAELARLEEVIERGARSFIEVAMALKAIRDARLYRDSHDTFEVYCQERWSTPHNNVDRMIRSAEAAMIVDPIGSINEAQARELAPLLSKMENGRAEKTIKKIVEQAKKEGPVTAKVLRVKVKAAMPKKPDASPQAGIKLHESTETICPTCHGTGRVLASRRIPR